ncbi:tetraspanin-8-like [Anoplopoma fimbria]|uniref:tetraspanin-8-like n=1 Tax=Anoplopoma fimbria TaxID=229290 RepID=UPI0023EB3B99|nr:tetraspanin-8-like [Anoplopoma fimbria]
MAQVNTCLKLIFTVFNVFFAIVGGIIIALALLSQVITKVDGGPDLEGRTVGLIVLYTIGAITMVIAILGAYGAHRENRVCLIVFLVCMVIGSLMMLRAGLPAVAAHSRLENVLEQKFRMFLPLDKASDEVKNMADGLQAQLHCCGLFSYTDWEDEIPDSCVCSPEEEEEAGKCQLVGYTGLMRQKGSVYSKTCFPIIVYYVRLFSNILIAVVFTLAALALIGMALSSAIIHQMRYPTHPTVLMSVPTIFTMPPPKYQELHNSPSHQDLHGPPKYQELHDSPSHQELHGPPKY